MSLKKSKKSKDMSPVGDDVLSDVVDGEPKKSKKRKHADVDRRSKSRSPAEKKHKHKHSSKKEKKEKKKKRKHCDELEKSRKRSDDSHENESGDEEGHFAEASGSGGGGAEISLSIEETNKLRASLGLAPLQIESKETKQQQNATTGEVEAVYTIDGQEFVHKPAKSLKDEKDAAAIREKLKLQREKRHTLEKLRIQKGLGEADEDEDSAANWVQKSRKLDEERKLAAQRAKVLEEMEQEFGVGELVQSEVEKRKRRAYDSKHLVGLTIEHSKQAFVEGKDVVLVLKDSDVLDEKAEDVLINPNLLDEEQWKRNVELRKKKPGYNPYEEEETDEFGMPKKKNLLEKYDEGVDGEKKKETFRIEAGGKVGLTRERELERIRQTLKNQQETLAMPAMQLAKEYYTSEEIAFKKPKKKVKVRKRSTLRADDLVPLEDKSDADYGSRLRGRGRIREAYEDGNRDLEDMDVETKLPDAGDELEFDAIGPDEDLSNVPVEEDAAELELQQALHKTRLKQVKAEPTVAGAEKVASIVRTLQPVKDEPLDETDQEAVDVKPSIIDAAGNSIVLDSISEYCRGLGDIPTYGMAGNRQETEMDELLDFEKEYAARNAADEAAELLRAKAGSAAERSESVSSSRSDEDMFPILEEPDVGKGIASTLQFAHQKGYVEAAGPKGAGDAKLAHLHSQNYSVMDKQFQDIDDKYAKKLDRMGMGGPLVDFKEKRDYVPDIKIEYADEDGRRMNVKEAFQYQSWKFHGKKPGKKKMERKIQKRTQEQLMQSMSSTDTPLGTLGLQQEKLKQLQQPFIVLSGAAAKEMGGATLRKD